MTSAYIAITVLKHTGIPDKQLRNFLIHVSHTALKEYLYSVNINTKKSV